MNYLFSLILVFALPVQAMATDVVCESEKLNVTVKQTQDRFEAVVFQKNSLNEWSTLYTVPVTSSTTRGPARLFLGEGFGLSILADKLSSGRHEGTLRLWLENTQLDEALECN